MRLRQITEGTHDNFVFYNNCVGWDRSDVEDGLQVMIDDGEEITFRRFRMYIDDEDFERVVSDLGYDEHMAIEDDYHVRYYQSRLHGERVYYIVHSAIEFVFVDPDGELYRKMCG